MSTAPGTLRPQHSAGASVSQIGRSTLFSLLLRSDSLWCADLTVWEVFNEGEHGYGFARYLRDFDNLVSTVRREADHDHQIKWMGVGGTDPNWIPSILDPALHNSSLDVPPLFGVSTHYYSGSSGATGDDFARDFFNSADGLIDSAEAVLIDSVHRSRTPGAVLDIDELGVLGWG